MTAYIAVSALNVSGILTLLRWSCFQAVGVTHSASQRTPSIAHSFTCCRYTGFLFAPFWGTMSSPGLHSICLRLRYAQHLGPPPCIAF